MLYYIRVQTKETDVRMRLFRIIIVIIYCYVRKEEKKIYI